MSDLLSRTKAMLGEQERMILDIIGNDHGPEMTELIATRLLMGQKVYGKLNVLADPRDFVQEEREELADAVVYRACAVLQERLRRGR